MVGAPAEPTYSEPDAEKRDVKASGENGDNRLHSVFAGGIDRRGIKCVHAARLDAVLAELCSASSSCSAGDPAAVCSGSLSSTRHHCAPIGLLARTAHDLRSGNYVRQSSGNVRHDGLFDSHGTGRSFWWILRTAVSTDGHELPA